MIEIAKIERSARKSLSVSVTRKGEVVIKAPLNLPTSRIQEFINEKRAWIEAKVNRATAVNTNFREVIEYKQLMLWGKQYYGYSSSTVKQITVLEDKILVPNTIQANNIHKKITKWYKGLADKYLVERTREISEKTNLFPCRVKCTGSRGRWGACNSAKEISLNWRCIMLPKHLIDYVIVHELSHLLELNHSPNFWAVVGQILPDFKARRKELKIYGFLLKLY